MKTTDKAINKLFYRLRELYGSQWVRLIGNRPIAEIKAEWLKSLDKYSAEQIGKALSEVKSYFPKSPPGRLSFELFVSNVKNCQIGHESRKTFDHGVMDKASAESGNKHLMNIRRGL